MNALTVAKGLVFAALALPEVFLLGCAVTGWVAVIRNEADATEDEMAFFAPFLALGWGALLALAYHFMFELA